MVHCTMLMHVPVVDSEGRASGKRRFVGDAGNADHGGYVVGMTEIGTASGELEIEFDLATAHAYAHEVLAGNARAITKPGAMRVLAASLLVMTQAARAAGIIQEVEGD